MAIQEQENELIEVNEELIELRQQTLQKANDALKAKLNWIINWQQRETSRSIMGRWDLGQMIDEIFRDKRAGSIIYGKTARSDIALFLREDPSIIGVAHQIFTTYPDRKILQEITEMRMLDGVTPLSYSHIRRLISVKGEQERQDLLNQCLLHCWTSAELGMAIQKKNGGVHTNNPSGRAAAPKSAETVIGQMLGFADDFDSRNIKIWRDPKHSLSAQVDKLQPTQYTELLTSKLGELAHRMRQLANEATARAEEAERKYYEVKEAMDKGLVTIKSASELVENNDESVDIKRYRIADRKVRI